MLRGHAAMRRSVSAQLQDDHGLTVNEYEALLLLSQAEGGRHMRGIDLANSLHNLGWVLRSQGEYVKAQGYYYYYYSEDQRGAKLGESVRAEEQPVGKP